MQIATCQNAFGVAAFAALGLALVTPAAQAQAPSPLTDHMLQLYSDPDEYYLFEDDRKKVVDYKTERMVRVCAGDSSHVVPLRVSYDGDKTTLGPGDCIRIEAKEVYIEPDKPLEAGWVLHADVDTLS